MVAFNTALGPLAISTSASQTQLTWIVDGYTVMLACLLLPAGAIGDRYGRRAALLCGMTVFAIASVSPAVFDSPPQIIAARMVAGIGAAFVMPATLSLMTSAYPRNERAKAIGIWAGVAGCAGVLGMLGSGALLHFSDWRTICWTFAGAALLVAVAARAVPASRNADAPPVDWVGAVLIAAAAAVTVTGLLHAPQHGWVSPLTLGCLAAGLACGSAFGSSSESGAGRSSTSGFSPTRGSPPVSPRYWCCSPRRLDFSIWPCSMCSSSWATRH